MIKILKATEKNIKKAADIIKKGGIVAFPTETVYGLGANVFDENAVLKIFETKKRPHFDPLIVHISKTEQLKLLAEKIPSKLIKITETFWPGPLTLIFKKNKKVPDTVTAGLPTVAVRIPSNKIALKLIEYSATPICAPSANKFTKTSPTTPQHIIKQFNYGIDLILDGGKTEFGIESTIIKYENNKFYLLRPGAIEIEKIEEVIKTKILKPNFKKIEASGQFKKHYSPEHRVVIVRDESKIRDNLTSAYIAFNKKPQKKYKIVKILSPSSNLKEAAHNLFTFFHELDSKKIKKIYVELLPETGLGIAINDRIRKASGKEE